MNDEIWRESTPEEVTILKGCESYDFTVFEAPNAGDFWVTCDKSPSELTTGWWKTEDEAFNWLLNKGYCEPTTKWLAGNVDL